MDSKEYAWWQSHRDQKDEPRREDVEDMDKYYLERMAAEAQAKGLTQGKNDE
jgi:hypothetical protein